MTEAIKKPYCHECGGRHFKDEPHISSAQEHKANQDELAQLLTESGGIKPCPVCAERRKKKAARMKRWRDKRRGKS